MLFAFSRVHATTQQLIAGKLLPSAARVSWETLGKGILLTPWMRRH